MRELLFFSLQVVFNKMEEGRLGLGRKGAKQLVARRQSSIDRAKPDQQHVPTHGLNAKHMIWKCIMLNADIKYVPSTIHNVFNCRAN